MTFHICAIRLHFLKIVNQDGKWNSDSWSINHENRISVLWQGALSCCNNPSPFDKTDVKWVDVTCPYWHSCYFVNNFNCNVEDATGSTVEHVSTPQSSIIDPPPAKVAPIVSAIISRLIDKIWSWVHVHDARNIVIPDQATCFHCLKVQWGCSLLTASVKDGEVELETELWWVGGSGIT